MKYKKVFKPSTYNYRWVFCGMFLDDASKNDYRMFKVVRIERTYFFNKRAFQSNDDIADLYLILKEGATRQILLLFYLTKK